MPVKYPVPYAVTSQPYSVSLLFAESSFYVE
jgi:hypothetical protein